MIGQAYDQADDAVLQIRYSRTTLVQDYVVHITQCQSLTISQGTEAVGVYDDEISPEYLKVTVVRYGALKPRSNTIACNLQIVHIYQCPDAIYY